jgi:hypothetical protein
MGPLLGGHVPAVWAWRWAGQTCKLTGFMPRKARLEFTCAVYHLLDRGKNGQSQDLGEIARLGRSGVSRINRWRGKARVLFPVSMNRPRF